ncbi:hypothetical protein ACH47F_05010, partial [Micrococcus luteus]|uniref:hypothetical protein n=1 Tax=Micrococcus luteus TaxID=1270 RepID=UPI00378DC8E8
GQTSWPPVGSSDGHQREETLAAYGQNSMALDTPLGPEMDDGPDAGHGVTVNMVGTGAEPSRTPLHRCTDAPMHRW